MIRKATRYDIPMLLNLIREYNKEIPLEVYKNKDFHDEQYVTNLLFTIIKATLISIDFISLITYQYSFFVNRIAQYKPTFFF